MSCEWHVPSCGVHSRDSTPVRLPSVRPSGVRRCSRWVAIYTHVPYSWHSSRYLREQFPHLKKVCGKDHLWTSSYYVGTAGSVSAETIRRYIMKSQGK